MNKNNLWNIPGVLLTWEYSGDILRLSGRGMAET